MTSEILDSRAQERESEDSAEYFAKLLQRAEAIVDEPPQEFFALESPSGGVLTEVRKVRPLISFVPVTSSDD